MYHIITHQRKGLFHIIYLETKIHWFVNKRLVQKYIPLLLHPRLELSAMQTSFGFPKDPAASLAFLFEHPTQRTRHSYPLSNNSLFG